jgi:hypothetical protein
MMPQKRHQELVLGSKLLISRLFDDFLTKKGDGLLGTMRDTTITLGTMVMRYWFTIFHGDVV